MKTFKQLNIGDKVFKIESNYKVESEDETPLSIEEITSIEVTDKKHLSFNQRRGGYSNSYVFATIPNELENEFVYRLRESVWFSDIHFANEELARIAIEHIEKQEQNKINCDEKIKLIRKKILGNIESYFLPSQTDH